MSDEPVETQEIAMTAILSEDVSSEEVPEDELVIEEDLIEENRTLDEIPDDELLWPEGPTAGAVKAWKNDFGRVFITMVDYDTQVVWRTLGRKEYRDHVKNLAVLSQSGQIDEIDASMYNEETISEMCTLFPDPKEVDLSKDLAGLPALLTQQVMEASGFVALDVREVM